MQTERPPIIITHNTYNTYNTYNNPIILQCPDTAAVLASLKELRPVISVHPIAKVFADLMSQATLPGNTERESSGIRRWIGRLTGVPLFLAKCFYRSFWRERHN